VLYPLFASFSSIQQKAYVYCITQRQGCRFSDYTPVFFPIRDLINRAHSTQHTKNKPVYEPTITKQPGMPLAASQRKRPGERAALLKYQALAAHNGKTTLERFHSPD